eukprot:TRINITY_DN7129_c0_g1_i1.p1 TRINITY_DN7129_c0_g1~~TRINITY_DN7129_c0_g1_i1.p1  ORF type:complete len:198 (-),score=50.52 TRINITY_DN7129_c0_g1_i1:50-643(-)
MAFKLPDLPYPKDALKPHISEETLSFHYGKHHAGYVTKLNGFVAGTPDEKKSLEELVKTSSGKIFNNAAQIWNHTFYWNSMAPKAGGAPTGAVKELIARDFGSFDKFKVAFNEAATTHFGSGWAWLVVDPADKKLKVVSTHDAGCPIRDGQIPLLTCDVWEHAYYLDYQNLRDKYTESWWNLVNWDWANKQLANAKL